MTKYCGGGAESAFHAMRLACHVHSDWSYDGHWRLSDIARAFGRRGYAAVLMSEHDRGFTDSRWEAYRDACAAASTDQVLLVPGIEYSNPNNVVHVLCWGVRRFLGEGRPTVELLRSAAHEGGVCVLAHPSRRGAWKCYDQSWTPYLTGIERWNRKTDGWAPSRTAPSLLQSTGLMPFVGLDFHTARQFFPLAMAVRQQAPATERTILDSLRLGEVSAHAFRLPINGAAMRKGDILLGLAEWIRRRAASLLKLCRGTRVPASLSPGASKSKGNRLALSVRRRCRSGARSSATDPAPVAAKAPPHSVRF